MFRIQIKYLVVAMISFMVFVACGNPSTTNNSTNPSAVSSSSPVANTVDKGGSMQMGSESKFNINTSLEPELKEIADQLKIDGLYDKIKEKRPYNSLDDLVSKNVLTQAQFD